VDDKIKRSRELLGKLKGIHKSSYIFRNKGNLSFEDETETWGLKNQAYSNGAAYADLDNDGDLDLVTNNINEEAFLYENTINNRTDKPTYLQVKLKGEGHNINGVGASITAYSGADKWYAFNSPVRGYLSSMAIPLSFGLNRHATVDSLVIKWPGGRTQILKDVPANRLIEADEKNAQQMSQTYSNTQPLFINAAGKYGIHYRHKENDYNDYNDESLLPRLYSKKGPGIAVGDVDHLNGIDFFIGGAVGDTASLFLQNAKGGFDEKNNHSFNHILFIHHHATFCSIHSF